MTALLIAMAFATSPAAQTGNPAFTPSGTPSAKPGVQAPHQLNASDRTVVQQLAIGNEAEIELGKLAAQKAQGQPVKKFAQTMVDDHDAAGRSVADMVKAAGLALPSGLDSEHLELREHLGKLNGAAFDAAYVQAQVQDHQKTLLLLEYEIGSGQDQALRDFAAQTLPTIRMHLQMAQELAQGTVPPAATAPASPTSPPAHAPAIGPSAAPQTPPAKRPATAR
jgi:putative membrane protein